MANHYLTVALCGGTDEFDCKAFNETHAKTNWCDLIKPAPPGLKNSEYCGWANSNWGTKWGTYANKAYELGGDGAPVLIEFESAWGPPYNLPLIAYKWRRMFEFDSVAFMGHDPYDNRTHSLTVCQMNGLPLEAVQ